MKPIRAIIVDDEAPARLGLRRKLESDSEIEIIAECRDGTGAVEAIRELVPDLVFLDIEMPGMNAFEVIEALDNGPRPLIVFITAYNHYAVEAFEVHAVDYILKPIDEKRFRTGLFRVKERIRTGRTSEESSSHLHELLTNVREERALLEEIIRRTSGGRPEYVSRIPIRANKRVTFVMVDRIDWIEAADDYVNIHVGSSTHLLHDTLQGLEEKLDPSRFVRIHRSSIVNIDRISELQPLYAGDYSVMLTTGVKLTLSRFYRKRLQAIGGRGWSF